MTDEQKNTEKREKVKGIFLALLHLENFTALHVEMIESKSMTSQRCLAVHQTNLYMSK